MTSSPLWNCFFFGSDTLGLHEFLHHTGIESRVEVVLAFDPDEAITLRDYGDVDGTTDGFTDRRHTASKLRQVYESFGSSTV